MTAPCGHKGFMSKSSKASEKRSKKIVSEVLNMPKYKDFTSDRYYETNSLYNTTLSVTEKTKKPTLSEPDFGLIKYKGKPVAIGDNKWQDSHKNVVERCNLYIADAMKMGIDLKNVLLIFDGPAFVPNEDGNYRGSSGKQIVRSRHYNTALINPTSEEIRIEFQNILDRIIEKENQ
jgi:hypothetical protein|tara:strand:- start:4351 stop:4878 length:528 start_codon:yes stop_codon:yes gene_type:complete